MSWVDAGARSYLFAPAASARVVGNALASEADVVVLDLEDSVAPSERDVAHRVLTEHRGEIAGRPTHVRVSIDDDGYSTADVALAVQVGAVGLRLPKVESVEAVSVLSSRLDVEDADRRVALFPTVESATGLRILSEVLAASGRIAAVVFGERDFLADLGADDPGILTDHARAVIAVESRHAGVGAPIDGAFIDLDDVEGLWQACERARAMGFAGKSAIHPRQLEVIHTAFSPGPEETARARSVVEAFETAVAQGRAVATVDGRFVDAAVARRAAAVVAAAERRPT